MKAYTKDIIKTIVKGKKRFFALMLITALGVCMFSGLKAACDDLRVSADAFYDEQNLFDISIVSTMGLTDEDVKVLDRLYEVEDVEGSYSETVFTQVDGKTKQAAVKVLSEKDINMPYLLEGDFPLREDEILVTRKYLNESGKSIGDIVEIEEDMGEDDDESEEEETADTEEEDEDRFELDLEETYEEDESETEVSESEETEIGEVDTEDTDDLEDEDSEDDDMEIEIEEEEEKPNFLYTKYTIVGVVVDATDVNSSEGAVSFRSTATTDYTFFVLPEAVDSDIYTMVYLTIKGTDELFCYSDEYEKRIDEIVTILEEKIKSDREKARYDEVTQEALDKIEDAESEMKDKFEEAEDKIFDAKIEIEDGWSELLEGQEELLKGEADIKEAERQLAKAQRELERAERELEKAREEIKDGWEEIEEGEAAIVEGEATLDAAEKELDAAEVELDEAEAELNDTEAQLPEQFESMRVLLEAEVITVKDNIAQTEKDITALEEEVKELEDKKAAAGDRWTLLQEAELTTKQTELSQKQSNLDVYNSQLETYNNSLKELETQEADAYRQIEDGRTQIADGRAQIADGRQEVADGRTEIEENKKKLEEGRADLEEAEKDFEAAEKEVEDGWASLEDGWDELEDAYAELEDGRAELEDGQAQFEDGKQEYEESVSEYEDKRQEALDKIEEAKQEIADLKMTEWYINTRTSLSGYSNVKTDAQCIESIGNAFPILFLTVAILISLTTISRMVEEDRGLIGTYKALGFTDKEIRRKYIIYALMACVLGGILGDFLGFVVLPKVIFVVFGVMYDLPSYGLGFNFAYGIGGILFFIVGIVGAAFVSCNSALSHMPAVLMRPKAPKNGSRVLLERFTPLWSRLSFLNKVTARNLFRYKKRLFMTLFGIAGCTSILLAGYTIKDTITEMLDLQYGKTFVYDLLVVADDNDKLLEYVEEETTIQNYINPMISNIKIINEEGREETVQLIVLPEDESLRGYVNLYDKRDNKLRLEDGDVFTTVNVANVLGYAKGDTITMQTLSLETADVEITEITMNYLGNYVYMTQATYEEYFGEFAPNGIIALLSGSEESQKQFAEDLEIKDGILSAMSTASVGANFDQAFMIINLVVTIVIVLAAALAFVVLFTLSTTNISERERELATIKVLGFFDKEVHAYVNKETLILTTLGILLGMPAGKAFGIWLMSVLQMPSIHFAATLYPISYVIAGVMATAFAFIVNFITDRSLDRINPVEALKSIE